MASVDWEKLRSSTVVSTRFLDNVVDANKYVPAVPQLREAALRARRIGLGIMGLGDLMYRAGRALRLARARSSRRRSWSSCATTACSPASSWPRSAAPSPRSRAASTIPRICSGSRPRRWPPTRTTGAAPRWTGTRSSTGIKQHGIRNAAQTTVAPTGTIGTVAGCEGYGCEPVFALAYTRTVKDGDRDLKLTYTSPLFEAALAQAGLDEATRERISEQVSVTGSCQDVAEVPEALRRVFVVASDITAEEHVRMQAAIQAFVDNSISKTINFPATRHREDVEKAYLLAWQLGCKGLTVYVTGSRQEVVLETKATAEAKGGKGRQSASTRPSYGEASPDPAHASAYPWPKRRPRPSALHGVTYRKETPLGTAYVTVNINGGNQPFEVFMNVGKAGSDVAAVSEALGRLISLVLRLPSPLDAERAAEAGRSINWPASAAGGRWASAPTACARCPTPWPRCCASTSTATSTTTRTAERRPEPHAYAEQLPLPITDRPIGDLCPDCGQAAFIPTEGCRKCYACGYSEC